MNQITRTSAAVCLTLLFLTSVVGAQPTRQKKSPKVDLEKTAALFQGWTTRPSFPESVPLAYYPVYGMRALGKKLPAETSAKIVAFLKSCQKPDGGFANEPKYAPESNIIYTYDALQALELLGQLKAIDRKQALAYVLSLQQPEGGFKAAAGAKQKPTLAATFYAVRSLALLHKLDAVEKEKTSAFIATYKEKGKGFSFLASKLSAPQPTFMAVRTLKTLGMLTPEIRREATAYLEATRYAGHVTERRYYDLPTMQNMSYVLRSLQDLSALDNADLAKVSTFIESLAIAKNGGFGPQPGYGTSPPSTYYGLVCFVQLGRLPNPLHQS
jgi:prenyltransferase beta subunit